MSSIAWTTAQIHDPVLRKFIKKLEALGFTGIQSDSNFGFKFDPMSGSEAALRKAMDTCVWVPQMLSEPFPSFDADDKAWTYYIVPAVHGSAGPWVAIVPELGIIYCS